MNRELPDVQAGFRKGRGTRDQIANIGWIIKKAREFQKNVYFCFNDYAKAFDCVHHNKLWEILKKRWEYKIILPASWEICMQVKKQQLELDMEQQTGSKSGKGYVKAVCCHHVCPTCLLPKSQNIKQKQYCNKLSKGLKNGPHQKKSKKGIKKNIYLSVPSLSCSM